MVIYNSDQHKHHSIPLTESLFQLGFGCYLGLLIYSMHILLTYFGIQTLWHARLWI